MVLNPAYLSEVLSIPPFSACLDGVDKIAIAVSGGADSMALAVLLKDWAPQNGVELHAITVDHALRSKAAEEAKLVAQWLDGIPHTILKWEGDKPETSIQAEARNARYDLMAEYCLNNGIDCLFVAHHQNDQAETVLMRLAKGSGLKGLSGMQPVHRYSDSLTILRPLLSVPKNDIRAFCTQEDVPYIDDPSNENDVFERVRLRKSASVLEAEGLSAKRLSVTAMRLSRAEGALRFYADELWESCVEAIKPDQVVLKMNNFKNAPQEIALRLLIKSYALLMPGRDYLPRMEKVENVCLALLEASPFSARTLGGLKFARNDKSGKIIISIEDRLVSSLK